MNRFLLPCAALVAALAGGQASAGAQELLDYAQQDTWRAVLDHAQSPIDIRTDKAIEAAGNEPGGIELWNVKGVVDVTGETDENGRPVQLNTCATKAMIRGRHFKLKQLHFHVPSEHTIDGKHFPLEGHFVFKAQNGRLAVLGVMYEIGSANLAIQEILDDLANSGKKKVAPYRINALELLPKRHDYYHYLGSLTTPPLTQNVEWYVLKQPVSLSAEQLATLRKHYPRNNRSIQPLNGRPVIEFGG